MMNKIRIITDSTSDILSPSESYLTVLPMTVRFGDTEYLDGVTITHREFYEKLISSDELPVTSLISPAVFEEAYKKAIDDGEKVIVITVSSKLSGTYQSAVLAAADYPEDVFVIDSENVAVAERILVRYAQKLLLEGKDIHEIVASVENSKSRLHILALLDTLEYLKKGGRISKTVAFIGGALSIKPVVTVSDGEVVMLGKARGLNNGNNYLIKEIQNTKGIDFDMPICLGYTGLSDSLLQKYIADSAPIWKDTVDSLPVCTIGAAIGTHVGPNAIAVAFFEKK